MAESNGREAGQGRTDKPTTYTSKSNPPVKFPLFDHISKVTIDRRMKQDVKSIMQKVFPEIPFPK